jgi:hypothetical protein
MEISPRTLDVPADHRGPIGANQPGGGAIKLWRGAVGRVANILWVTETAIG